jgi:hypothetical protein
MFFDALWKDGLFYLKKKHYVTAINLVRRI